MLVGIDHVQFGVPDLSRAERLLRAHGYETRFTEPRIEVTGPAPTSYRQPPRGLVYLSSGRSAVELIESASGSRAATYLPVARPGLAGADAGATGLREVPELAATFLVCSAAPAAIEELVLPVGDLVAGRRFWEALGGRVESGSPRHARLVFERTVATMPLSVTLVVAGGGSPVRSWVDDAGCALVAIASTDVAADAARTREAGGVTHPPFQVRVAGRELTCTMVTGPGGEMVELLQARRGTAA